MFGTMMTRPACSAVIRDQRVILLPDSSYQLSILAPSKPEEVYVFTDMPSIMR